jgi:uncharacterized protein (DUF4415 family)
MAKRKAQKLAPRSEADIRKYAKSPAAKQASQRLRAHLAKHGGEPSAEDLEEIPAISEQELARMRPAKEQLTIRLDADVLHWLKSKRGPYQTRLNAMLRAAMLREARSK